MPERLKYSALARIPRGVWMLGFVSLFMDVSSEMVHALLPLYLAGSLGVSFAAIGLIEGVAEAVASIAKVFSGALSDWLGNRKGLATLGYGLAAATKPVFPLAHTVSWIAAARFTDRIGKGLRGAPRDALVADLSPPDVHGASFGLRQALDTTGAFIGPLVAVGLMAASGDNISLVLWAAVPPAFLSLGLMIFGVGEPPKTQAAKSAPALARRGGIRRNMARLGAPFWIAVLLAMLATLPRFSDAFLILRAQDVGSPPLFAPLIFVVMNAVAALFSYPAGALSDKSGRLAVLCCGLLCLAVGDAFLAWGEALPVVALGAIFWGAHLGFVQGTLSALVSDAAPAQLRGTAFGIFNFLNGLTLLAGSAGAGALWQIYGPGAAFSVAAGLSVAAFVVILAIGGRFRPA